MIEKNASGKYVLTEEDVELLARFSYYYLIKTSQINQNMI